MGRESGETTPRQALMQARIVWAAMMLSILGMGAAALFLIGGGESSPTQSEAESGGTILPVIALVALLGGTFVGYLLRQQAFKAGWTGNAVKPQAFLTGNDPAHRPRRRRVGHRGGPSPSSKARSSPPCSSRRWRSRCWRSTSPPARRWTRRCRT